MGRAALLFIAALALLAISQADLAVHLQLFIALLVIALTIHAWRPSQPLELKLHPDGSLACRNAASPWQPAKLLRRSVVNPWLSLLAYRLEEDGRTRVLTILPDSLDADAYRRLRVWLRWRAVIEGDKADDKVQP
jgi:toxin CptA